MSELRLYVPGEDEFGSDDYPVAWKSGSPAIKDLVREKAGHRCVRCQHPYVKGEGQWSSCDEACAHGGPWRSRPTAFHDWVLWESTERPPFARGARVQARYRILTVHHLNGVKADCRWWNLAALCQRCHLEIQGRVVMDRVWPYEHSFWFKPYVAGYYAWRYLREEITREEAIRRMDELLALEVRQLSLSLPPQVCC